MLRRSSPFDTTLLHLDKVNNNLFVEIDTRNGYEYHKVLGYHLDKNGSLSAVLVDVKNPNSFRYVLIARASGLKRGTASSFCRFRKEEVV